MADEKTLLQVDNLKTFYPLRKKDDQGRPLAVKAVNDVSLTLKKGEILGVVGESGCGKSTLGRTILRLEEKTEGSVLYRDQDVFGMNRQEMKDLRRDVQMIFQDPYSSLNPRRKVLSLIGQPLKIHGMGTKAEIQEKVQSLMAEVGINPLYMNRFPHQFSGGQRQRIGIARALALQPRFMVCDEAVSALDVSVQAQILNLLLDLREKYDLTYLFIAHDLAVVEFISTRILVMYLGKAVEWADKEELVQRHLHPYTKALFEAFPMADPSRRAADVKPPMGDVPSPINPPAGCFFHPRCPYCKPECTREYPETKEVSPGHFVACHLY